MTCKLELNKRYPHWPVEQLVDTRQQIRKFVDKHERISSQVFFTEVMYFDTITELKFLWMACGDTINELSYRMLDEMDETKDFKKITEQLFII